MDTGLFKIGNGSTSYNSLPYGAPALLPTGSRISPVPVTAVDGITPSGALRELLFISGSGGPVDITAVPQIADGTVTGQELVLQGGANSVQLNENSNLEMNGDCVLGAGARIWLVWDGTIWGEVARNDKVV